MVNYETDRKFSEKNLEGDNWLPERFLHGNFYIAKIFPNSIYLQLSDLFLLSKLYHDKDDVLSLVDPLYNNTSESKAEYFKIQKQNQQNSEEDFT